MASRSPAFLDANILMYAIGEDHPYKRPCVTVLKQIEAEALQVVTSVEVLQEILHRYHSLREYATAATAFTNLKKLCETILPVREPDVDRGFRILQAHPRIRVRDAIHAGTMLNNGLRRILSTDRHFDDVEGIVRIDPATLARRRRAGR